jgi:hypothetical protein
MCLYIYIYWIVVASWREQPIELEKCLCLVMDVDI